jgi:hypothetical protein
MPIKMTSGAVLPPEAYNDVAASLAGPLSHADGFMFHTAERTPEGIQVTEVWASREQFQRFFDAAVRPNLPPGVPEPTLTDLPNTIAPAASGNPASYATR